MKGQIIITLMEIFLVVLGAYWIYQEEKKENKTQIN